MSRFYLKLLMFLILLPICSVRSQEEAQSSNYDESASKSPLGAMLRSLALPGWGQIYVRQYWKAPLFFAGAVIMYYYTFKHHKDYLNYSRQYDEVAKISPNDPKLYFLKVRRENSRDNRDISMFFLVGVYGLSMLDAYVDAHLYNFDVSDKVAIAIRPCLCGLYFSFSVKW